jgi:hypothetical protein
MSVSVLKLTNELMAFNLTNISKMVLKGSNIWFVHSGVTYSTDEYTPNSRHLDIHPGVIGDKERNDDAEVVNFWSAYINQ